MKIYNFRNCRLCGVQMVLIHRLVPQLHCSFGMTWEGKMTSKKSKQHHFSEAPHHSMVVKTIKILNIYIYVYIFILKHTHMCIYGWIDGLKVFIGKKHNEKPSCANTFMVHINMHAAYTWKSVSVKWKMKKWSIDLFNTCNSSIDSWTHHSLDWPNLSWRGWSCSSLLIKIAIFTVKFTNPCKCNLFFFGSNDSIYKCRSRCNLQMQSIFSIMRTKHNLQMQLKTD